MSNQPKNENVDPISEVRELVTRCKYVIEHAEAQLGVLNAQQEVQETIKNNAEHRLDKLNLRYKLQAQQIIHDRGYTVLSSSVDTYVTFDGVEVLCCEDELNAMEYRLVEWKDLING